METDTPENEVRFTGEIVAELNNERGEELYDEDAGKEAEQKEELEELEELEESYDRYAEECEAALTQVLLSVDTLKKAIDRNGKRNPFDRVEHRMKTFRSVRGKCKKKGYPLSAEGIHENITDIAGIRIITKYIDEIDLVREMLERMPGINIVKIKDYVKQPKANGYQSVHLDCRVGVYDPYQGSRLLPVEIQIRSKSMNLWATLEHDLKYKNSNPSPEVDAKFLRIAKILRDFEEEAIALRDYSDSEASKERIAALLAEPAIN